MAGLNEETVENMVLCASEMFANGCDPSRSGQEPEGRGIRTLAMPTATTSLDTSAGFGEEVMVEGYVDRWRELEALGIEVIAVRDTPRLGFDAPECLATGPPQGCTAPRTDSMAEESPLEGVVLPGNVVTLDLTDLICEPDLRRSVVGNVLVFWDSGHISATCMRTLAPNSNTVSSPPGDIFGAGIP